MGYSGFLNKTCNSTRKSSGTTRNDYGERINADVQILDGAPCRLEKLFEKELLEAYRGGDHGVGIMCVYFEIDADVREGDVITVEEDVLDFIGHSAELKVVDVDDAGGHGDHLETYCKYRKEL